MLQKDETENAKRTCNSRDDKWPTRFSGDNTGLNDE
jgi:hypothetical protein